MGSHMITTSMANEPAVTLGNPTNRTLVRDDTSHRCCVFSRVSKWLWSDRSVVDLKPHYNLRFPSQGRIETSGKTVDLVSSGMKIECEESEALAENMPCRACQSWGVTCDLQRPRCSHCLDEQILCFYVAPLRLTMARLEKQSAACM